MNLSGIPGAVLALVIFGLAILVLGGLVARAGRAAQAKVGAVI